MRCEVSIIAEFTEELNSSVEYFWFVFLCFFFFGGGCFVCLTVCDFVELESLCFFFSFFFVQVPPEAKSLWFNVSVEVGGGVRKETEEGWETIS